MKENKMKKYSGAEPFKLLVLLTTLISVSALSGCATKIPIPKLPKVGKLPPPPQLNKIPPMPQLAALFKKRQAQKISDEIRHKEIEKLPITDPLRKEEFFEVLNNVSNHTKAIPLSDNRLRISTRNTVFFHNQGPMLSGENLTEQNFFIRAAAETLKAGYDGFAIVHIDYYKTGVKLINLTPSISFSSQRWIGTYEDFLDNKNEQNMFSSRRKVEKKMMDGIIIMLNNEDHPNRKRFSADEIYLNLITYRAE